MKTIQPVATVSERNPDQILFQCPGTSAKGDFFLESFSSGLQLLVMNMDFSQPITLYNEDCPYTIGMSFIARGKSEDFSRDCGHNINVTPGISGYFTYARPVDMGEKIMAGHYQRAWVIMEPETLTRLANEDEQSFAPFIDVLKRKPFHLEADRLTPAMGNTLQQIFNCPYQGKIRSFFLESKMLELLAGKLEQIQNTQNKGGCRPSSLKPGDRERVHQAARILEQGMENPPNLSSLARAVGLSRSKFHPCFCREFGLSPLEYLRDIRLCRAKRLLEQGRCNVTEAAFMVGYSNPGYFSQLFQERYLSLPSELVRRI